MRQRKTFVPGRLTLLSLMLVSMLMLMGGAAVAPALPLISLAFPDASSVSVSLIITLPALAIAMTGYAVGHIADRFGKVRTMVVSLVLFTVAGASGYFLDSLESILLGRFILGIGIAGITVATTSLITEYYMGLERAKVISYQSAAIGIGVLVLEMGGGYLAESGWREPFLIYLLGLVILIGVIVSMREPFHGGPSDDASQEKTVHNKRRLMFFSDFITFAATFLMFTIPTKMPYFITELGGSSSISGFYLGIMGVCVAISSLAHRYVSRRLGSVHILIVAFLSMGTGLSLMALSSLQVLSLSMVLVGVGMGLITPTVMTLLAMVSTPETSGKVMGAYSVSLNLGQFASSILLAPILAYVVTYENMFLIVGVMALVICGMCSFLTFRRMFMVTE